MSEIGTGALRSCWTALGGLAAVLLVGPPSAAESARVAQVAVVQGRVVVIRNAADGSLPALQTQVTAKAGLALYSGDTLKSESAGRAKLLLEDGSVVNLGSSTKVAFQQVAVEGERLTQGTLALQHGVLHVFTAPSSFSKLGVATPTTRIAARSVDYLVKESVRGTDIIALSGDLSVHITPDGASSEGLTKGGMRLTPGMHCTPRMHCVVPRGAAHAGPATPADAATTLRLQEEAHVSSRLAYRSLSRAKVTKAMLRARAAFSQGKKAKARTGGGKSGDVNSLVGGSSVDPIVPPLSRIRVTGRVPTGF